MEIGDVIREARTRAGMTMRTLGKRMKVSHSAVSQWEAGDTVPSIENRVELSRLLKVPFVQLLPEAGIIGELAISDPTIQAIVRQLLKLPPQVRQTILGQVAALAEVFEQAKAPPPTE